MKKNFKLEQKLDRMQEISQKLEEGTLPLDELLQLYEEGIKLSQECRKYLDEVELKIETISNQLEQEDSNEE
jgi:exodeoxyribonuclease VII small subunit